MDPIGWAAVIAAILLLVVAVFHAALAAGAPWGDMAYGGQAKTAGGVLPGSYRAMSAVAVSVLSLAAWVVLARGGVVASGFFAAGFLRVGTWVVFGYLVVNTVLNLASSHPGERFGFGAITLVSAMACFVVARASGA